ncbi:MAG: hypothetical protein ACR2IR_05225, partial [Acidimicrobiia bacterium]
MSPTRAPGVSLPDAGADGQRAGGDPETGPRAGRTDGPLRRPTGGRGTALIVAGLTAMLAIPLLVALGVLRQPRWYPTLDLAWTELRVRDVSSSNPPLVGLAGRIGTGAEGSHLGPLSFYAMWPFYRLFGASAWALQAAAVALHVVAMGAALWIAHRRGGVRLVLGVAVVLAILARAHGAGTLTEPWNPWLPLLWWMVFLLAVWSVVCDDLPMLPVAAFSGSFCVQTHIPYLGITAGLGGLAITAVVLHANTRVQEPAARRHVVRWVLITAAVGVVVWLPPVIDQLTGSPGNLTVVRNHFSDPPEPAIGARQGIELLLVNLNPWRLVPHLAPDTWVLRPSLRPGSALLAGWATAVVVAWRLRHRALLRLHLVLGVALALAAVSLSRIFGFVWYYLVLWVWGIAVLMVLAIGWTVGTLVGRRLCGPTRSRAATGVTVALAGVTALSTLLFTIDAAYVNPPAHDLSRTTAALAAPTAAALDEGTAPGGGRDGRYLVTWEDPISLGSTGFGLLLELERRGFDVGAVEFYRVWATPHRVMGAAEATAEVHLAVGADIETWRATPGAEQVAYVDPRSREERAEYRRLRARAVDALNAAGLADLAQGVDENLFTTSLDPRVPLQARDGIVRMLGLGLPSAVF